MREIVLTKGQIAIVDDDAFDRLNAYKWYAQSRGDGKFYAARRNGRGGELLYMHREINSTPDGLHTDHIDGNTLNNSRSNLRTATPKQNSQNRPRQKRQALKGAWFDASGKTSNRWRAAIRLDGKLKYLGRFATQEDAASAYAKASAFYFGEYNRSNP